MIRSYRLGAVILLCWLLPNQSAYARPNPAHCVRYGFKAICRSPIIDQEAFRIARKLCGYRCKDWAIVEAINGMQVMEGPYDDPHALAHDALLHAKRKVR